MGFSRAGVLLVFLLLAGCTEPAAPTREETERPRPPGPIETLIGKQPWQGSVQGIRAPIFEYMLQYPCYFGVQPCLYANSETWVSWSEGTSKMVINLTWNPTDGGTSRLGLAVTYYDWDRWPDDVRQEIRYVEGLSPLQVNITGRAGEWSQFNVRAEIPEESGFVMKQPFTGEITQYRTL